MSSFNFVLHKDYLTSESGTEIFRKMLLLCFDFSKFRSGSLVTQLRNEVHILMRKIINKDSPITPISCSLSNNGPYA